MSQIPVKIERQPKEYLHSLIMDWINVFSIPSYCFIVRDYVKKKNLLILQREIDTSFYECLFKIEYILLAAVLMMRKANRDEKVSCNKIFMGLVAAVKLPEVLIEEPLAH